MFETALRETKVAVISNNPISILHVDDDVAFLKYGKTMLRNAGRF